MAKAPALPNGAFLTDALQCQPLGSNMTSLPILVVLAAKNPEGKLCQQSHMHPLHVVTWMHWMHGFKDDFPSSFFEIIGSFQIFPVMRFTDTHGCWLGSESDSLVVAPKVGMLFRLGRWQPFTRQCDFQAISGPKTCKAPEPTAPTPAPALAPAPATPAPVVSSAGSKHNRSRFHF